MSSIRKSTRRASRCRIDKIWIAPSAGPAWGLGGAAGAAYKIESADSLNEPVLWTPLTRITLTDGPALVIDPEAHPSQPHRFYRVVPVRAQ